MPVDGTEGTPKRPSPQRSSASSVSANSAAKSDCKKGSKHRSPINRNIKVSCFARRRDFIVSFCCDCYFGAVTFCFQWLMAWDIQAGQNQRQHAPHVVLHGHSLNLPIYSFALALFVWRVCSFCFFWQLSASDIIYMQCYACFIILTMDHTYFFDQTQKMFQPYARLWMHYYFKGFINCVCVCIFLCLIFYTFPDFSIGIFW